STRSTSVVTVTVGAPAVGAFPAAGADIAGAAASSFGTPPLARSGTVSLASPAAGCTACGPSAGAGATWSFDQAMYNSVATTSQAKIRKVRVWFMDCAISGQPAIVPGGSWGGNAPARRNSAS